MKNRVDKAIDVINRTIDFQCCTDQDKQEYLEVIETITQISKELDWYSEFVDISNSVYPDTYNEICDTIEQKEG